MKYLLLLPAIFFLVSCGSNTSKKADASDSTITDATKQASTIKDSSFTLLRGTIGQYPITVYLFAVHHIYSGFYYYDSQQQPIDIAGSDTGKEGKTVLTAYNDNDSKETFTLLFEGSKTTGNWQLGKQQLPVTLTESHLPMAFDYVTVADSLKLSDTLLHSPMATATAATVWPKGNTATDNFIKQHIAQLYDEKHPQSAPRNILQMNVKSFLKDYRTDSELMADDLKDSPESLNYDQDNDLRIAYLSSKLLVLSFSNYSFTGGMHGNFGTSYLPLNLQQGKVLRLQDVLTPAGIQQLRTLLEKSYRQAQHLQPNQQLSADGGLLVDEIKPNNNFYVTGKNLVFSYQPYEIAPYAAGEVKISIDYKALQNFLQPTFTALLQ